LTGCIAQGGAVVSLNAPTGVAIVQTSTSTAGFQLKITDPAQTPPEYFVSIVSGGPDIPLSGTAVPVIEVQADGVQTGGDAASSYLWDLTLTANPEGTSILNPQATTEDLALEVINFSCENPSAGPTFLLSYDRINSGGTGSATSISFKIVAAP
jgi:hypothetical protein